MKGLLLVALGGAAGSVLRYSISAAALAMLGAGFLDEVRALRARPGLHAALPALRAVGYRQAWQALDAGLTGQALRAAVRERGIAATRQLAKRQLTWLRSMPQRAVVPADAPGALRVTLPVPVVPARGEPV